VNWYFCFNEEATDWFSEMIKVAVTSARANTTLTPHCIYDGRDTTLIQWLRGEGVTIHRSEVPFRARLRAPDVVERNIHHAFKPEAAAGYYLPLQIPQFEHAEQYVLFTDCDIMFLRDVDLREYSPMFLAAAREIPDPNLLIQPVLGSGFNSGVMLINVEAWRRMMGDLIRTAEAHGYYKYPDIDAKYDQGLFNSVFRKNWTPLPDELNWRVFSGVNREASIIHWHGPKPVHVANYMKDGSSDLSCTTPVVDELMKKSLQSYLYYYNLFRKFLSDSFRFNA
jgi:hypothetical protein